MTQVWDAYWEGQQMEVPSFEPAYAFVVEQVVKVFGALRDLRVVELGAGRGDISFLLAKAGARVTLVDSSETALRQARMIFEEAGVMADFLLADLFETELSIPFDVAMSFGLVEHFIGQERRRLFEMHRAGRIAFIAVPNALCIPYRLWKATKEATNSWPYGREVPFMENELRRDMQTWFGNVRVFTTPLSFNLIRKLGIGAQFRLPLDSKFGYQLVGCGTS